MIIDFTNELKLREKLVTDYILSKEYRSWFKPAHLKRAVYSYLERGGKRLRPAILLFSCGIVGGREDSALPAAAALELFHTWTLVHDDIIDNDRKRRGLSTIHEAFKEKAAAEFGYSREKAAHYGKNIAILAGDCQQAWSVCLLAETALKHDLDPGVALKLIYLMESRVVNELIRGETLDFQFEGRRIEELSLNEIVRMLRLKTGILYEFAGRAGAMIGLNHPDENNPQVKALAGFASRCGIAFQLQDDILGILGDEKLLGKPVGSDIQEGKRTTIVYFAYKNADEKQKKRLDRTLGNKEASPQEIEACTNLLIELKGIEETRKLADSYLHQAYPLLDFFPDGKYKKLLLAWADFMVNR
ncbi:MAG: polyprenyl synthetase family protein, partial [bacterium]